MATYPAPTYQHHTVPICGAPFIPPSLTLANGLNGYPPSSPSSSSRASGGSSPSSSSPTSPHSPHGAAPYPYRSADAVASTSSGSFGAPTSPSPREAALSYARMLHSHTASMWELERQNIERARLDAPRASAAASKGHRSTASASAAAGGYIRDPPPPPRASPSSELPSKPSAMSYLLGRARSVRKDARASNDGKGTNGHKRGKTTLY